MNIDTIYTVLAAAVPSVTAIIGIVVACVKIVRKFGELKTAVKESTELKNVEAQLHKVLVENAELKRELKKTVRLVTEKIDKIYTGVDNE